MAKRKTQEEFDQDIKNYKGKYKILDTKYKNRKEKKDFYCPDCGNIFSALPYDIFKERSGCPFCANERKKHQKRKITYNIFVERSRKKHGNKYDYHLFKELINTKTEVPIFCPIHGVFWQTPEKHMAGQNCPFCVGVAKITYDIFVERSRKKHNNFYSYDKVSKEIKNVEEKVSITCPIHGEFNQRIEDHMNGSRCPYCTGNARYTVEYYKKIVQQIHGDKYILDEINFNTLDDKIKVICPKHGPWYPTADNFKNGTGCPRCNESHGEKEIAQYLEEHNISFEKEKRFKNCKDKRALPFDFYLPKYNTCIEYDGIQHFEAIDFFGGKNSLNKLKKRDKIKTDYCLKNHIRIIRIKFYENIIEVLNLYFGSFK